MVAYRPPQMIYLVNAVAAFVSAVSYHRGEVKYAKRQQLYKHGGSPAPIIGESRISEDSVSVSPLLSLLQKSAGKNTFWVPEKSIQKN